jgi:hypothetical protein
MPSAFTVSNSPLTANGTIGVAGAGTLSQYIRGDGSLADFPESSGGGGSVSYYLNGSVDQGTIGGVAYKELNKVPILGAGTDFTINADGYIASFITDAGDPNLLEIPGGNWNFETYFSSSSSGGTPTFYVELYKYDGTTFTLIASSVTSPEFIAFGTTLTPYFSTLAVPTTTLALTDRLAVRYYVTHSGRTITLHTENNHLCQIITTFTTGLTALNGLTAQVQNFAVGTTGTDFNIASAVSTHTFNLPTASATNRGALSSADWALFTQAYNDKINSAAVTGTTTKTLTLTQQDGGTITASWSDLNTDAVLSVFGRTGAVVAVSGDYTTAQVTESGNLYYTDARSRAALSFAAGSGAYNTSTGVITIPTNNNQITNGAGYITSAALSGYLPLTGGTLTGPLGGTSIDLSAGFTTTKTSKNAYAIQIKGSLFGAPRLQVYDLAADPNAYMGLGTDMSGAAYEFSNYFPRTGGGAGRWSVGSWAGNFGTGQYVSGYNEKLFITESAAQFNVALTVSGNISATNLSGTNTGNVTIGTGNGLSLSGQVLSLGLASAGVTGALSGTDWSTFNSKQNALTNPVTGTGTTNVLPKFTGTSTIGNSAITDDGATVNIISRDLTITRGSYSGFSFGIDHQSTFAFGSTNGRRVAIIRDSTAADNGLQFGYDTVDKTGIIAGSATSAGAGIDFYTFNGSTWGNRIRVTAGGNVLIGTTTDNGARLNVNGVIRSNDTYGFAVGSIASYRRIQYGSDNATSFTLLTDGNAYAGLYAGAATFSSSVDAVGRFGATTNQTTPTDGTAYFYKSSAGAVVSGFQFIAETGGAGSRGTRLTIDNAGAATFSSSVNVGGVSANTDFRIYRTVAPSVFFSVSAPGGTPNTSILGINGTDVMALNANGNVLIGTQTDNGLGVLQVQGNIILAGGSSSGQSQLSSGFTTLRFPNQYSSGFTDAGVKLFIFNSGATIQGFTAGPQFDLQYHCSGSSSGRHAFYVGNSEIIRFNQTTVVSTGSITAPSFFESSDATLKTLVEDNYQAKGIDSVVAKFYIKNGKEELGYFAQDLQAVLPSAVSKGSDGLLNLSYREVHTAKIAYLEEKIKQLEKKYEIN